MKTTFIKTLTRPIGKGEVWYCRSSSTDVVRERLCLFSGEEGLPPPLTPPFLLLLWVCGAGQPPERFVSLTPALTWHLGHRSICCLWQARRAAAFHMCSQGLPIGVLSRRGWSLKSAPVPMTDYIFMHENKTRISDGLHYLSRQLGATTAK